MHHVRRIEKYPIYHPKRGYVVLLFIAIIVGVYFFFREFIPRQYRLLIVNLIWPFIFVYNFLFRSKSERFNAWIRQLFNGLECDAVRELYMSGLSPRDVAMGVVATRLSRELMYWRIGIFACVDIAIGVVLHVKLNVSLSVVSINMIIVALLARLFIRHVDVAVFNFRSKRLMGFVANKFGGAASKTKNFFKVLGTVILMQIFAVFAIVLGLRIYSGSSHFIGPYIGTVFSILLVVIWLFYRRLIRRQEKMIESLALYYEILLMAAAYGENFRLRDYPELLKRFEKMK